MNKFQPKVLFTLNLAILLSAVTIRAASLTVDTAEPTTDVIASLPHSTFATGAGPVGEGDTFTTVFSAAGGYGSRGQTFLTPNIVAGTLWDVSAITIRADANRLGVGVAQDFSTFVPSTLNLWVFEWNPNNSGTTGTQWTTGDGSNDNDPFDGTGISNFLINGDSFDITRSFSGEFLHFNTPGLQFAENTAYGILVSLQSASTAGLRLDIVRDNVAPTGQAYPDGSMVRSDATANAINSNGDDLVFYVQGTAAVPEPASMALFGIGLLAMAGMMRRRG